MGHFVHPLFDAAAALTGVCTKASFEGQGPMLLEAMVREPGTAISLPLNEDAAGVLRSDWQPLLPLLRDEHRDPIGRAEDFHSSMAKTIVDQAIAIRQRNGVHRVGLVGGVFQNRVLTEQARTLLAAAGFDVHLNRALPCNDAALSFGQAAEWAALRHKECS